MVMKKAFTMIELIMVIIVLGIVASIGAEIIVKLYDNYMRTRTINALETKTEVALEQIAKRFQYRIKDSTIARRFNDATGLANNILPISSPNLDNTYKIIEWIGYSNESFLGTPRPGWSGFIDMDDINTSSALGTLKTPDSNLTSAQNIMNVLTRSDVNLTANHEAALIFKRPWDIKDFGWEDNNANHDDNATLKVIINANDIFQTSNELDPTTEIYEQYYLAASAYALVPDNGVAANTRDFNLTLYYNYAPWLGQNYTNGNFSVLVEHVNLFHFRQDQTLLRFKLCIHDANQTGFGERIVVCKEKVVY
jgi:prepilin-type N-terminal cleavage/methylation domain-containing protein